jgi:hypothetical protein
MLDLLPDVFQDPAVYDRYFTPLPGYQVIPKIERGYVAVIPNVRIPSTMEHPRIMKVTVGDNPIISIQEWTNDFSRTLVDVRCGCAVVINRPFIFVNFFEMEKWLVLRDIQTADIFIWRTDSIEPLVFPIPGVFNFINFHTLVDRSGVILHHDYGVYSLPIDLHVPFAATQLHALPADHLMMPTKSREEVLNRGGDGTVVSLTQRGLERANRFVQGISATITDAFGCSLEELRNRLQPIVREIRIVSRLINRMHINKYAECWLLVMEMSKMYDLRTRAEFIDFIVAVVDGSRPPGIDRFHPLSFFSNA